MELELTATLGNGCKLADNNSQTFVTCSTGVKNRYWVIAGVTYTANQLDIDSLNLSAGSYAAQRCIEDFCGQTGCKEFTLTLTNA